MHSNYLINTKLYYKLDLKLPIVPVSRAQAKCTITNVYVNGLDVWIIRFVNPAAARRAQECTLSVLGTELDLEAYEPQGVFTFVCKTVSRNIDRPEIAHQLAELLPADNPRIRWTGVGNETTSGSRRRQKAAFELNRRDIWEVVLQLNKLPEHIHHPRIHFRIWLVQSLCGICHSEGHSTMSCSHLTVTY